MASTLTRRTEAACKNSLKRLGFRVRFSGTSQIDLSAEVIGSVGLNRATNRWAGTVEVNPVIGVSHLPLEQELARIRGTGRVTRANSNPTLFCHLGYLTPRAKYTPWTFSTDINIDQLADQMAAEIERYGMPFMLQHRSLRDFYESMRTRRYGGLAEYFAYLLPVAAVMLGEFGHAREHTLNYLDRIREESGVSATDYRSFADNILRLIV